MRRARSEMDKTGKSAGKLGGALKSVGTIAGGFLAGAAIQGGFNKLTGFLGDSIDLAKEQARVEAQLNAVIKSTGGAAGVSAEQIKEMAAGFQAVTNFGDEATIASSNVLLTFTKIGGDVFPRAQKAILDMSAALGQDLQSSTIQVGKALNDPIRGVSALQRVGITFTDSQRDMIQSLQEAGDVAGAQAVILKELETQFKGSAEAAVEADGGITQAENAMGDLQEQIGAKMIPIMVKFKQAQLAVVSTVVNRIIPAFNKLRPTFEKFGRTARRIFDETRAKISLFIDGFKGIGTTLNPDSMLAKFNRMGQTVGRIFAETRAKVALFIDGLKGVGTSLNPNSMLARFNRMGLAIRKFARFVVNDVVPAIIKGLQKLPEVWERIRPDVETAVSRIVEIIGAAVELIKITIQRVVQVTQFIWEKWGDDILRVVSIAWDLVAGVVNGALQIILGIINTVTAILKGDWQAAWDGIKQILQGAWEIIKTIVSVGIEAAKMTIKRGFAAFKELFNFDEAVGIARDILNRFIGFLAGLPSRVASAVFGIWEGLWSGFKGVLNKIIQAWNNLEFKLPSFSAFGVTVGGQTFGTPNLPLVGGAGPRGVVPRSFRGFASGGIGSGVILAGEQGPELVDLSARRVHSNPDSERMLSQGMGGAPVTVNLFVEGSVRSDQDLVAIVRDEFVSGGLADVFAQPVAGTI